MGPVPVQLSSLYPVDCATPSSLHHYLLLCARRCPRTSLWTVSWVVPHLLPWFFVSREPLGVCYLQLCRTFYHEVTTVIVLYTRALLSLHFYNHICIFSQLVLVVSVSLICHGNAHAYDIMTCRYACTYVFIYSRDLLSVNTPYQLVGKHTSWRGSWP